MMAILARAPDKRLVAFAYDLESGRKYPDIDVSGHKRVSYVTISPLGNYVLVHGTLTGSVSRKGDANLIYDLQGRQVGPMWRQYGRPSHFDLAVDNNGDEVAVGVSKSGPEARRVIKRRLRDGEITVLTGRGYASHTSARNIRKPGWVFVSYSVDKHKRNRDPYHSEIVAVPLDGSMDVRRIAQTRSVGYDQYLAEPHGSPSPDGSRVIWASNWGNRGGPIGAYVATLPAEALSP